jgi:hypothetical protein
LSLSYIGGCLPLEVIFQWRSSSIDGHLPLEAVFHWRSSSIGGRLNFKQYSILFWPHKLKFKIWGRSNEWLLRYSTINMLSLSSMECCLPWNLSSSLKFDENLESGCWDIPLLIFWGHLPWKVVFHGRSSSYHAIKFWFGLISLSLKFEEAPIRSYWDIPLLILWGRLLL